MNPVFAKILNMSLGGSILILAVILIRVLFARIPRRALILLWILVMIRLICPLSITNPMSPVPGDLFGIENGSEDLTNGADNGKESIAQGSSIRGYSDLLCFVWASGVAVVFAASGIKTAKLRKAVRGAECCNDNVYLAPAISSSFVLGIFKPKIYVPAAVVPWQRKYIIDHEKTHIRCGHNLIKLLFYAALAVHWFNPLCHIAYRLFSEDLEMACDERTVSGQDSAYTANYVQTLLDSSKISSLVGINMLSFGSVGVKRRIERIMDRKKISIVVIAAFAVSCIAFVFFLMPSSASGASMGLDDGGLVGASQTIIQDADGNITEVIDDGDPEELQPSQVAVIEKYHVNEAPHHEEIRSEEDQSSLHGVRETVLRDGVYRKNAVYGEPVYAVCQGTVVSSRFESPYGNCVTIVDNDGLTWKYGHFSELAAKEGDAISVGNVIGYAGTSGITAGPAVLIRIVK